MEKFCLKLLGKGLGDTIFSYLSGDSGSAYLKSLKEKFPRCTVRCISAYFNSSVKEFLRNLPNVDEFIWGNWEGFRAAQQFYMDNSEGYTFVSTVAPSYKLARNVPEIYLSKEDKEAIKEILSGGPYIAFHPFAGGENRNLTSVFNVEKTIEHICDLGHRVVLLGGDYERAGLSLIDPTVKTWVTESLDLEHPNLINLINKHNVRVQAYLASRCSKFIGTWSAYSHPASVSKRPSLIFMSEFNKHDMSRMYKHGMYKYCYRPNVLIYYILDLSVQRINREILDFAENGIRR